MPIRKWTKGKLGERKPPEKPDDEKRDEKREGDDGSGEKPEAKGGR